MHDAGEGERDSEQRRFGLAEAKEKRGVLLVARHVV